MDSVTVAHIFTTPLQRIAVNGGDVLHAMKCSDLGFAGFGEAYFSMVEYNFIKPWKRHKKMTLNLVVPLGQVQFIFFDNSGTCREEIIGKHRYVRLTVPPGIWFAFKGLEPTYSLLMNIANIAHSPDEVERRELRDFDYDWDLSK